MTVLARVIGVALALLASVGLVLLSDGDLLAEPSDEGLLRLSWRAVGQRVEECRVPTAEELAALPQHMRQKEICEGALAPFDLDVRIDGVTVVDRELRAEGAREDRPTYVFDEIRLPPGPHALEVVFAVAHEQAAKSTPPLRLATTVDVPPRGVVLVTHDDERGGLEVRHSVEGG